MVRVYVQAGYLTAEESAKFEEMFRKCRSQEEQRQVSEALRSFMNHWKTGVDTYSRLLRDDLLDDDEDPVYSTLQRKALILEVQAKKR